jgi:hypothetical protein
MAEHCWHKIASYQVCLGNRGTEQEMCCHCGKGRDREWEGVRDTQHGPFYTGPRTRVYKPLPPTTECRR